MIRWSVVAPVLVQLFADLAVNQVKNESDAFDVTHPEWKPEWADRPVGATHVLQQVTMTMRVATVSSTFDENRLEMLDTGLVAGLPATSTYDLFETAVGFRKFVLQVQAWVLQDQDTLMAIGTIERLKTRLGWNSSLQRLLAINVDLTDIGPTRNMSAPKDGRQWSVASMDVTLTAAFEETDTVAVGFIERVVISSHVQAAEGDDLPAPLQMVDEVLPPEEP